MKIFEFIDLDDCPMSKKEYRSAGDTWYGCANRECQHPDNQGEKCCKEMEDGSWYCPLINNPLVIKKVSGDETTYTK